MNRPLHICIHGAGGLGSLIGGYLANAGIDTTLIARPAHVERIAANGLQISGTRGDIIVREHLTAVTHPDQVDGDIDYYILLTKVKDAAGALSDAAPIADRIDCALSLQNGIGKEAALIDCFGPGKVIGGSIIEGATLAALGHVRHHVTVPVTAYFGEFNGARNDRCERLADSFTRAGLGARACEDIHHVLWEKVVQVGGASAWSTSTLSGMPALDYWDGLACAEGAAHYIQIAKELLAVYGALGYGPQNFFAPLSRLQEIAAMNAEDAATMMGTLASERQVEGRPPVRTSMHGDVLAGRKTEVDIILRPLIDAAAEHSVPIPTALAAYRVIKTLDTYLS
ncbi:MAG: ketopantoate reductase family protein [Gammaproteobacteria bacterium]